jgi:hypothetical protein
MPSQQFTLERVPLLARHGRDVERIIERRQLSLDRLLGAALPDGRAFRSGPDPAKAFDRAGPCFGRHGQEPHALSCYSVTPSEQLGTDDPFDVAAMSREQRDALGREPLSWPTRLRNRGGFKSLGAGTREPAARPARARPLAHANAPSIAPKALFSRTLRLFCRTFLTHVASFLNLFTPSGPNGTIALRASREENSRWGAAHSSRRGRDPHKAA